MTEGVRREQPGVPLTEGILQQGSTVDLNISLSQVLRIGLGSRDENCTVDVWREENGAVGIGFRTIGGEQRFGFFSQDDFDPEGKLTIKLGRFHPDLEGDLRQWVVLPNIDKTIGVSRRHALLTLSPDGQVVLKDGIDDPSKNRTYWRLVERRVPETAMPGEVSSQVVRAAQRGSILETSVRGGVRIRRTPNQDPTGEHLMDQGGEMKQTEVLSSQTSTFVVLGVNQELERPRAGVLQTNVLPRVFQALKEEAAQVSPGLSLEEELERVVRGGNNRFVDKSIDKRGREGRPQRGAALAVVAIRGDGIRAVILGRGNFEITTISRSGTIERWENRNVEDARYQFGDTELSDRARSFTQFPINRAQLGSGGTIFVVNTETYPIPLSSNLDLLEAEGKYHGRVIAITL